jgi:hypothetical protein
MLSPDRVPVWWDRESDDEMGIPMRPDVRNAAHRIWPSICQKTQHLLGDNAEAARALEGAVKTISRYLNKLNVPPDSTEPDALLVLSCYRFLQRLARKRRRIELVGSANDLSELLRSPDWRDAIDRQLLLEELARNLSGDARGILRLRMAGYEWQEIGRILRVKPEAARQKFWREVRKAHLQLLRSGKIKTPKDL